MRLPLPPPLASRKPSSATRCGDAGVALVGLRIDTRRAEDFLRGSAQTWLPVHHETEIWTFADPAPGVSIQDFFSAGVSSRGGGAGVWGTVGAVSSRQLAPNTLPVP